ncbi:beta propeller domain-containing protein [Ornithinimicrobium humiphilum]|uniref:Beta propeller domain-containing protein n=1 Tax=Ornithinimicrobium humiphilum TaxID=125288 RepID=A0A543K7R1_9MICO|nr:beta-propeller domain-containing protein [Ornithinimicrobium humiphilum]TQM91128.1 beta propeller domain-containing protein [Ornithinimicrobium humiphilum]
MPRTPALLALCLGSALALASCAEAPPRDPDPARTTPSGPWDAAAAKAAVTVLPVGYLADFDDCADLLTYYQANALELVGPYGLGGGWYGAEDSAGGDAGTDMAASEADGASRPDHSTTNVQEEGVDEPDVVKTDGRIIVTVANGSVRIVDAADPRILSTVPLPGRGDTLYPSEVLLHEGTLVVLSQEWSGAPRPVDDTFVAFSPERTVVTRVDVSDPSSPRVLGSVRLEGGYRSARLVGDALRMVMVTEPPGVVQTSPRSGSMKAEQESTERNRELIRATTIDDWVPHVQVLDARGQVQSTDALLGCDQITRPRDPAGLSTMSVLTFDLGADSAEPVSATGLVASGGTVYASPDRLVVATSAWDVWAWAGSPAIDTIWPGGRPAHRTSLHVFDISDPTTTTWTASGEVPGHLLNQWALDEEDGVLRVATTLEPAGASQSSSSSLVVLREDDGSLVETGRVDGLGVTETIRSVRYLNADLAAVVTFRQTDPLYLIDTSDPAAPRVAGELKIPGYSAYLHPIGEGRLLGVGQDADERTGRTKGLQMSLFDISDPSAPRQLQVLSWPDSYSTIEQDHRAFTWWPATGQVVLPVTRWGGWEGTSSEDEEAFGGVTLVTVDETGMTEGRSVSTAPKHRGWGEGPQRTVVIGDSLWTLDWQGLARFDLATLEGGWVLDLP